MAREVGTPNRNHCPKLLKMCDYCDGWFEKYPSQLRHHGWSVARFCSGDCQRKGTQAQRALAITGPLSPHWKGGKTTYRERAFSERGERCEECGYAKYKTLLWVHHKNFKSRKAQDDHSLENLEVLCIRCHLEKHVEAGESIWEGRQGALRL